MVDAGPWGWFWRDVGSGQFDFAEFARLWGTMPSDAKLVARWVHDEIVPLPPTSVSFIILQAASFGSTPVWWDGTKWRRGEGNRRYKARSYWEPKPGSKETKPRGTIFRPEDIPKRIESLLHRAHGVRGVAGRAEDTVIDADVIYIDPPYGGTSGYGCDIAWRSIVSSASSPVLVSEAVAFDDATEAVELVSRKGASLNGKSKAVFNEWLNVYQPLPLQGALPMPEATDDGLMLTEAYRPYHLADIIGQDKTKKLVGSWLRTGRVPRSILVSGETSAGKTTSARIIGRAMLCVDPKSGQACGECRACKSFDTGNHPDYIEIDAASDRGIDAIRALTQRITMKPIFGKKKVVILDEAHQLTPQAWQAMLKTLEEPPLHVVFMILTTNPEKLPQTIIGRCSMVKLQAVSVEDCTELLVAVAQKKGLSKTGLQKEHLVRIAKVTSAHPRNALHALEQVYTMVLDAQQAGQTIDAAVVNSFIQQVSVADVETVAGAIIRGILDGKPGGALKRAEDVRAEADILLAKITEMMRQAMLLSTNPKLMDGYYKDVFDGVGLFAFTLPTHQAHIEARQVVLDSYACFTRLRIETSNHQVPVGEVIGEPIARASLLCQKFLKTFAPDDKKAPKPAA